MIVISVTFILFIAFSAFFSASETALFSLKGVRLRRLQEKYPRAKRIKHALEKPSRLLSTIVLGNMLVNIGLASLSTAIFVKLFNGTGVIISIIFSGVVILFIGEILPKTIAIYSAPKLALFASPVIEFLSRAFYPVVFVLQRLSSMMSSLFTGTKRGIYFTEGELKTALILGKRAGAISASEEEMIQYVLKFKDTSASQIMTPRVEVKAVNLASSRNDVLKFLKEQRHSKFPVYEKSMDNIRGVLYSKDIFLDSRLEWKRFIKDPVFIPESKKIDDVLTDFIKRGERIVVVLDEYGGTSGIVTFEDIVEEIFGELYDEYEFPQKFIDRIGKKTYRISAKAPIKSLNLELDINLPEEEDSLAGFILSHLERIPVQKDSFKVGGIDFMIERATRKRILSVIIKLP